MKATTREFTRQFPRFRRAARTGQTIRVRDRDGVVYVFAREKSSTASLADVVGHLKGSVKSGRPKKTLEGFGRD